MAQVTPRSEPAASDASPVLDPHVLDGTCLAGLSTRVATRLLAGAREYDVVAGQRILGTDGGGRMGVLLGGSGRAFLTAADGRQLTVRYVRAGSLMSPRSDLSGEQLPLRIQAVSDCRVLELDRTTLMSLAAEEPKVAMALMTELSGRLLEVYATVADAAFGSMRQRIARHLLALAGASAPSDAGRPVARVTQQQLADGIGSAREVVARTLAVLRDEGLIRTAPGEVELLDVRRLTSFLGEWRTEAQHLEPDLTFEAERLLEASPNAVVAVDADGAIVFSNSSLERAFGWPSAELIGRPIEVLLPEGRRGVHVDHRTKFLEAPTARAMGPGMDLRGRRRDGSEFPVSVSLTTIDTRDGTLVIATAVELAEPR